MPSFLRTSAGTEIWPCAVTLDCGIVMATHYQGNGRLSPWYPVLRPECSKADGRDHLQRGVMAAHKSAEASRTK